MLINVKTFDYICTDCDKEMTLVGLKTSRKLLFK